MLLNCLHYLPRALVCQHAVRQADGEDLIRPNRRIGRSSIRKVEKAAAFFVPEQAIEAPAGYRRHIAITLVTSIVSEPVSKFLHDAESVVPKRLNLYRLPAPGSYHPIPDLRVHPGDLRTRLTAAQQAEFKALLEAMT